MFKGIKNWLFRKIANCINKSFEAERNRKLNEHYKVMLEELDKGNPKVFEFMDSLSLDMDWGSYRKSSDYIPCKLELKKD